jgi:hypothetical protein
MNDDLGVDRAAPTHRTGDDAIEAFQELFGENARWAGLGARVTFTE